MTLCNSFHLLKQPCKCSIAHVGSSARHIVKILFVSIGITGITGPTCSLATLVCKLHGKNDVKPNIHDTIWLQWSMKRNMCITNCTVIHTAQLHVICDRITIRITATFSITLLALLSIYAHYSCANCTAVCINFFKYSNARKAGLWDSDSFSIKSIQVKWELQEAYYQVCLRWVMAGVLFVTCVNNIQWSAVSCCFFAMLYCHLTLLSLQRKLVVFHVKTQPLLGDGLKEAHISDMLDFLLDIPVPTSQLTNVTWNGQVCVCFVFTIIQIIMCILCACACMHACVN